MLPFVIDEGLDEVSEEANRVGGGVGVGAGGGEILFFKGEAEKTLKIKLLPPKHPSEIFVITIALGMHRIHL